MRARILLALALGIICPAAAQPTSAPVRVVSLRDCFQLALARNLDIQLQRLSSDVAGANVRSAYGPYDPLLSFNARHDFITEPANYDLRKFNPYFPAEANIDTLGPSLTGKLPMGLSYNFSAFGREDNGRTDFSSNPADALFFPPDGIRETNNYVASARVTVQQHLLRDFWIDADREQLLVRRKELKMSEQALRFQVMKTLLTVELSYTDLIAARENVRVQEKSVELRQQLVSETRRRVEVGDLPPLDSEQAETQLQNSLTAITAAREELVARQNALKSLLTDDFKEWADLDLRPADSLPVLPADLDRAACFANAEQNRPDLAEARLAVQRSDVTVKFRYNQLFPSLDVVAGFGGNGVQPDPGPAIGDAIGFHNPDYFYGAVLTIPLTRIGERGSYQASKAVKQIAELQLKKAEQDVLLQVADLINRAESRFAQVASTRKARTYAEAALDAEQKKLANGFSTSFFVLQLQETLTAARTAELQAVADYNKALAQLAFAQGITLDRHRLTIQFK
jgi:outer membrane protein